MTKKYQKLNLEHRQALPVGETIFEHGIRYARTNDGDGTYAINIMVDGERINRVVGRESAGVRLPMVERYIEKLRFDARENRLALPKGRKTAMRFEEAAPAYLKRLAAEGGKNLVAKQRHIELHLMPHFGRKPLSAINEGDIESYKQVRLAEKAVRGAGKFRHKDITKLTLTRPGTVNRELATLRHLRNMAVRWAWIAPSAHRVRVLPDEPTKTVYLSVEECKNLLDCARVNANPLIYPFIFIGLETSMRLSEILNIRREHVDISGRAIFIPKAKAGARQQPMTGRLALYLESYLASLPKKVHWLFPSATSKTGHVVDIRKPFVRAISAAGLDPRVITPHVMRHTAITHAIQAGVDLPTVQRISGHKTLAMVVRYAHSSAPHVQEAMNKLEARFKEAA